jgi:uncharacterized protein
MRPIQSLSLVVVILDLLCSCSPLRAGQLEDSELLKAAVEGNLVAIKAALTRGASVEARDLYGATPWIKAVSLGKAEAAELLLQKGATVNGSGVGGRTPLMIAATRGRVQLVNLLLNRGANINATDAGGETALMAFWSRFTRRLWRTSCASRFER